MLVCGHMMDGTSLLVLFFDFFWRVAELRKVLAVYERNDLSELCEISNVIWE